MLHRDCSETLDLVADRRKGEWTMKPVIAADTARGRYLRRSSQPVADPALISGVHTMSNKPKVPLYDDEHCIGRVSYSANLDVWNGSNYQSGGTGRHLGVGRTRTGQFYLCYGTQWQGERDYARIVTAEEAKEAVMRIGDDTLYRQLFGDELPTLD
jgi:hypothetical protein